MAIESRGENRWRFRIRKDGQNYTMNFYGTEREAKKAHNAFKVDVERGEVGINKSMKFGDYTQLFYDQHMKPNFTPVSIQNYTYYLESRILPKFGDMKLDKIRTVHIDSFYNELSKDLSYSSIKTAIHGLLSNMFNKAIIWGLLKENPCTNATIPRGKKESKKDKEEKIYNHEEIAQLFEAIKTCKPKGRLIILLALGCMLRRGEICALTWSDIDFKSRTLRVDKAVQHIRNHGCILGAPKTESSIRTVPMPQFVIDALHDYKKTLPNVTEINENERYLFAPKKGGLYSPHSINTFFDYFIKRTGLRKISIHGLRHTGATLLIYNGLNIQAISNILGHGDVTTTGRVYLHSIQDANHIAANMMDDAIKNIGQ